MLLGACALAGSCAKARPDVIGAPACVSWKEDIGSLFTARCQSCHAGVAPAGGYDTSSYLGTLGGGSDAVPNAAAGDASSRLLTALDPATADTLHRPLAGVFPTVRSWVVDCDLSYTLSPSSIHRRGILDPAANDFHGRLLRDQHYAFGVCQSCHGEDFSGGTSQVSCLGCHAEGPTACSTCHGDIGASGSHAHHLGGGPLDKRYGCRECHVVPSVYTDVGHIFLADGSLDPAPAEVTFDPSATAALTPAGSSRQHPPSYDPAAHTCSDVYCHGAGAGVSVDIAATHPQPSWNAPGTGQAACGSCHGLPPNHANSSACVSCHPSVVDKDQKIIAPDKHIDGHIDLADLAAGCTGCHGGPAGPAPPRSLTGETATSAPGVGAHAAHLGATAHLRGPIACNECHTVPTEVSSPGHFGGHAAGAVTGARVFPADPAVGRLAAAEGATPHWDVAALTCGSVYCHGGGTGLAADTTAALERTPRWTAAAGLTCGQSCHGLPPSFSPHLPTMTRQDCASCHPRTVDPAGVVIISGPPGAETSAHINGVLDVAP
ncbi:MAG TPA: CxxxxCH/CxxCH domain-containing protein [Polyangia bacterium]|nr:CxxxxCH/CxxCH domain-containing protein [Polyangia bacterium]